jgi:hypothetical protein
MPWARTYDRATFFRGCSSDNEDYLQLKSEMNGIEARKEWLHWGDS